jgi:hypothetical protein
MGRLYSKVIKSNTQNLNHAGWCAFLLIIIFLNGCSSGDGDTNSGGSINDGGGATDDLNADMAFFVFDNDGTVKTNRVVENDPPSDLISPYNYSEITAHYDAIGISRSGVWKDIESGTVIAVNNESFDY